MLPTSPTSITPSYTGGSAAANAEQTVKFGNVYINHGSLFWPVLIGLAGLALWAAKRKK